MAATVYVNSARHYDDAMSANAARPSYDWARLHAAATDRSFVGRVYVDQPSIPAEQRGKRIFDCIAAGILLFVLAPVMLIIACLVRRDGGAVFFGHRRVGANGQTFR